MTWSKTDIEEARSRALAPILKDAGYKLDSLANGAVLVRNFRGLVVRGNTWFWKEQNLRGNTIDFFMVVEAKTFAQTMAILCPCEEDAPKPAVSKRKAAKDLDQPANDSLPF
jgi:hypothetical protein